MKASQAQTLPKRYKTIAISAGILFTVISILTSCSLLQILESKIPKPGVELESLKFDKMNLDGAFLTATLKISNPYPFSIPKGDISFRLNLDGTTWIEGKSQPSEIAASGNTTVQVPFELPFAKLLSRFQDLLSKDTLDFDLSGKYEVKSFKVEGQQINQQISIPFQLQEKIPVVIPTLDISEFQIQEPDWEGLTSKLAESQVDKVKSSLQYWLGNSNQRPTYSTPDLRSLNLKLPMSFNLHLANKASTEFDSLENLVYNMSLDGYNLNSGKAVDTTNESGTITSKIQNVLDVNSMGQGLLSVIRKRAAGFRMKGSTQLSVGGFSIPLEFDKNGNLNW